MPRAQTRCRVDARANRPLTLCLLLLLTFVALPSRAQMMHLDPLPFFTPADSTSRLALVVDIDRFHDSKFDWQLNRLLLTVMLPAGDDAAFFLRLPYLTFDTGQVPLGARWPWVLGAGAEAGWPDATRLSGFGKVEAGVTGPVVLPLVRGADYGVALGLPTSADKLYPFSARSIPFRAQVRKPLLLRPGLQAGILMGYLLHVDSGGDELDPFAFAGGFQVGASLAGYGRHGARWQLTWDFRDDKSRRSQLLGVQGWIPWADAGAVGLKLSRELQGTLDRPAEWYFTLSWRLDSPKYRQGLTPKPEARTQ